MSGWPIELPTTATNKILKRELIARGANPDGGVLWTRDGRSRSLHTSLTAA